MKRTSTRKEESWKPTPCIHNQISQLCPHCEKPQPTPTPWMVFEKGYFRSICTVEKIGSRKRIVKDMSKEDAAFIVRAVNSHEELYSALKNIVAELDRQFPDSIREPLRSLVVKADQAIAKAEGK